MRGRVVAGVVAGLLLAAGVLVALASEGDPPRSAGQSSTAADPAGVRAAAGSRTRFTYLAGQHSNACGLQADTIMRQGAGASLQGSCCSAMEEHAYREQVRALRAFREIPEIPRDPYDISVRSAKRLLRFDRGISLTPGQRSTYRRAMRMSDEKGPCCCPCWRWNAFRGLSKFLIARRGWSAAKLAELIDALEGCGGPAEHRHS